jgi:hypothetical protein
MNAALAQSTGQHGTENPKLTVGMHEVECSLSLFNDGFSNLWWISMCKIGKIVDKHG